MDNELRINQAITALDAYSEEEDDLVSKINDLLTDLMRYRRLKEIDFHSEPNRAARQFEEEIREEGTR